MKCQHQWQDPIIFFSVFTILFIIHKRASYFIILKWELSSSGGHEKQNFGRMGPPPPAPAPARASTVVLSVLQCGMNLQCDISSQGMHIESVYTEHARHMVIMGFSKIPVSYPASFGHVVRSVSERETAVMIV